MERKTSILLTPVDIEEFFFVNSNWINFKIKYLIQFSNYKMAFKIKKY